MNWYISVFKKYAVFNGRARRKEYWMFVLFSFLFAMAAAILDNVLGTTVGILPYGLFYFLFAAVNFLPSMGVLVRRLHDIGKSGWMFFIVLIPIVGAIWLLVLLCTDGNPGENAYGANPKLVS